MKGVSKMEQKNDMKKSILSAAIFAAAMVSCCAILVCGFLSYKKQAGHTIAATGSASVDFDSDLVVWRGYFTSTASTSKAAYDKIKKEASLVDDYLKDNGISSDEIVFNSVDINENYDYEYDDYGNMLSSRLVGYTLQQGVVVSSSNIDAVEKISRDISSLLDSGVEFDSYSPEYYCTTLDDVKLDLIDKATENARQRIRIIASESGARIGGLANSNLGVFQITAANTGTSDYTYDGYYDTSSRQKTATITVRLEYSLK